MTKESSDSRFVCNFETLLALCMEDQERFFISTESSEASIVSSQNSKVLQNLQQADPFEECSQLNMLCFWDVPGLVIHLDEDVFTWKSIQRAVCRGGTVRRLPGPRERPGKNDR